MLFGEALIMMISENVTGVGDFRGDFVSRSGDPEKMRGHACSACVTDTLNA